MRCFVAVALPEEVKDALGRTQAAVRAAAGGADVRWTAPGGLHVTLQFLGEVPETDLATLTDALVHTAGRHAAVPLVAAGIGAFPSPARPRVIWAGIDGPLAPVAAAVGAALGPLGYPPDDRPFRAHVTLGRVRRPVALAPLRAALDAAGRPFFGAWTAAEVVLYRSHLRPAGSVYEPLARVPLLPPCP